MSSQAVNKIKEKLSIVDVVRSYVKLDKAGKNYKARSPFTNEKDPSFFVVPDKDFFYCFSSGKGGDIFNFIQEIEKVDFKEALQILAERAGVELTNQDFRKRDDNSKLYLALEYATRFFGLALRKEKKVMDYLHERGLTDDTIKQFRVGYAKDSWDYIYKTLTKNKIDKITLSKAGLIKAGKKDSYDRFRARVIFPLFDIQGKVIGFSGRVLPWGKDQTAKYLNSPEGPLFDKSKMLYGFNFAKKTMSKDDVCIVVEGQLDLIMAHQTGTTSAVGISGTGLTDFHLSLIKRFTNNIIFALDADDAGLKALSRSVERAYARDFSIKIAVIPEGEDPASIIKKSPDSWKKYLDEAKDYLDFMLTTKPEQLKIKDSHKKDYIYKEIFPIIDWIGSMIVKDKALQKTADFLGVSVESVRSDYEQIHEKAEKDSEKNGDVFIKNNHLSNEEQLISILLWQRSLPVNGDNKKFYDNIEEQFNNISQTSFKNLVSKIDDTKKEILIFKVAKAHETSSDIRIRDIAKELIILLELNKLGTQQEKLLQEIRTKEAKNPDDTSIDKLQKEVQELSDKIMSLKNKLHSYAS